jgi:NAD(P)-dependent dehydrogenase (short-subunit alcohol dehydrogenase family)
MNMGNTSPSTDYVDLLRLDGEGVIVFGAGQGIGEQVCHALAQAGARVLCVDRDADLATKVAKDVDGTSCIADVTQRIDVMRILETASSAYGGQLRGLVDIVGVANVRPIEEFDDAAWNAQFDIVLRHAFLAVQLGGAALARVGGGAMTFIGSISGEFSVAGQAIYGTAKAALHHLVRCSAHELGPRGIRVNAVAPSFVRTPRLQARLGEEFWRRLVPTIPMRRIGEPADVAAAVLFLQSRLAQYVTANVLTLDGGTSAVAALLAPSQ